MIDTSQTGIQTGLPTARLEVVPAFLSSRFEAYEFGYTSLAHLNKLLCGINRIADR